LGGVPIRELGRGRLVEMVDLALELDCAAVGKLDMEAGAVGVVGRGGQLDLLDRDLGWIEGVAGEAVGRCGDRPADQGRQDDAGRGPLRARLAPAGATAPPLA